MLAVPVALYFARTENARRRLAAHRYDVGTASGQLESAIRRMQQRHVSDGVSDVWAALIDTFRISESAENQRELAPMLRRNVLWALRGVYANDPCRATIQLSGAPVSMDVRGDRLVCADAAGRVTVLALPGLEVVENANEPARRPGDPEQALMWTDETAAGPQTIAAERGSQRLHLLGAVTGDLFGHTAPIVGVTGAKLRQPPALYAVSADAEGVMKCWSLQAGSWGRAVATHTAAAAVLEFSSTEGLVLRDRTGVVWRWRVGERGLVEDRDATAKGAVNPGVTINARGEALWAPGGKDNVMPQADAAFPLRTGERFTGGVFCEGEKRTVVLATDWGTIRRYELIDGGADRRAGDRGSSAGAGRFLPRGGVVRGRRWT